MIHFLKTKLLVSTAALLLAGGLCSAEDDDHRNLTIHPDCMQNPNPYLCTDMVTELLAELAAFNDAFIVPNATEAAAFYHQRATLYTSANNTFYIGHSDILSLFFVPFVAALKTASVDFRPFHFSVISPSVIVSYGRLPASLVLANGTSATQPPLPQTVTWVRNEQYDRKRPFLIISDHE